MKVGSLLFAWESEHCKTEKMCVCVFMLNVGGKKSDLKCEFSLSATLKSMNHLHESSAQTHCMIHPWKTHIHAHTIQSKGSCVVTSWNWQKVSQELWIFEEYKLFPGISFSFSYKPLLYWGPFFSETGIKSCRSIHFGQDPIKTSQSFAAETKLPWWPLYTRDICKKLESVCVCVCMGDG